MEAFEAKAVLAAVDDLLQAARAYMAGEITLDETADVRASVKYRMWVLARRDGSTIGTLFRGYLSA